MAKIIYKEGCEGENKLSSIEGIAIDLFNGQKALIYPKYAQRRMLDLEQMRKWSAKTESEIEALKVEETNGKTVELLKIESPAAKWASQFWHDKYGIFCLPSLLAALEIQHQKEEIDALAETIEGADLLKNADFDILTCSRSLEFNCWTVGINSRRVGYVFGIYFVIPTILYR